MRVGIILAGLVTLFSTTATGAPGYAGGLGFCFDDTDCRSFGGSCFKTDGKFVGQCLGGHRVPGMPSAPSSIVGSPSMTVQTVIGSPTASGSGAARYPDDIGAIASRVATRTDLPAAITAFAQSIANRPEYASRYSSGSYSHSGHSGSGSGTYTGWKPHKTAEPSSTGWGAW